MHQTPTPHDRPALRPTRYQVWHGEHALSPEYDTRMEAEMFQMFDTPGTDDYRVRLVHATTPTETPA